VVVLVKVDFANFFLEELTLAKFNHLTGTKKP
jgi:hypothetical protein